MRGAAMHGTGALSLATLDVSPVHQSYPGVRCIVIGHCVKRLVHHRQRSHMSPGIVRSSSAPSLRVSKIREWRFTTLMPRL
jgi:hypothetical protein